MKAAMVVRIVIKTGGPISIAPSTAAFRFVLPISWCEKIFSPTTIASSTTIPSTRINANRDIIFIVVSSEGIAINAPAKLIGIPIIIQKDKSIRKNSAKVKKTSPSPSQRFFISKLIRSLRTNERSFTICISMLEGSCDLISSIFERTAFETSVGVCLPTRKTLMFSAGFPLNLELRSDSSNPSLMRAMSPSLKIP